MIRKTFRAGSYMARLARERLCATPKPIADAIPFEPVISSPEKAVSKYMLTIPCNKLSVRERMAVCQFSALAGR